MKIKPHAHDIIIDMFDYKKPELRQQFDIIALHCEEKYFE